MRHALLLLVTLALSFKAVAAGVVPIVGAPGHAHATSITVSQPMQASATAGELAGGAAHEGCSGHPDVSTTSGEVLHEHTCPHLGMASAVLSVPILDLQQNCPAVLGSPAIQFTSVEHDVPSPPPTFRGSFA